MSNKVGLFSPILLGLLFVPLSNAHAQTWSFTGNMAETRREHTMTLLPTGEVLVAGGMNFNSALGVGGILSGAELYDAISGTWNSTNPMSVARVEHSATLLDSGDVLIVGGLSDSNVASDSAELYNVTAGTWSTADSMDMPRFLHTATKLVDGRVLVTGGIVAFEGPSITATTEMYDPSNGLFTPAAPMGNARFGHAAVLLNDGKVLVMGGNGGGGFPALASAEIYDPATNSWTPVGSMSNTRGGGPISATKMLDGKVLVMGGSGAFPRGADIYNPATQTFSPTKSSNEDNYFPAILLSDGRVLETGGLIGDTAGSPAQIYDPATATWTTLTQMNEARTHHTVVLLPGDVVLVAGGLAEASGSSGVRHTASAELLTGLRATPIEQAEAIVETVVEYSFPKNIENSYLAHLKKVATLIEEEKFGPAINQLTAFTTKVEEDYADGRINMLQRDTLVAMAASLIADLE